MRNCQASGVIHANGTLEGTKLDAGVDDGFLELGRDFGGVGQINSREVLVGKFVFGQGWYFEPVSKQVFLGGEWLGDGFLPCCLPVTLWRAATPPLGKRNNGGRPASQRRRHGFGEGS